MTARGEDESYLEAFYEALGGQPLDPGDPRYLGLYADPRVCSADPVAALARTIEWSPGGSAQLLSGARGVGTSTELRRLRRLLEAQGAAVVLCEMERHLHLATPVDIGDFLVSLAGSMSDAVTGDVPVGLPGDDPRGSWWPRAAAFLARLPGDGGGGARAAGAPGSGDGGDLAAALRVDPTFRARAQERLRGRLAALSAEVHAFVTGCADALRERHDAARVVLLVDSMARVRGTSITADDVAASIATLFEGHAGALRLPGVHVVYTAPPWLAVVAPGVRRLYDGHERIACVGVRDHHGEPRTAGLDALERLIAARGEWRRLLGNRAALDGLCLSAGGHIGDLFRLLRALLRLSSGRALPADRARVEQAEHEVRAAYLPLTDQDAVWLDRIDRAHAMQLDSAQMRRQLPGYLDAGQVLIYRDGEEWWSVHPLIAAPVRRQAASVAEAARAEARARERQQARAQQQ